MKVIKRSGEEVNFDIAKIENAIRKASQATPSVKMHELEIQAIAHIVAEKCEDFTRSPSVEEIQDLVENDHAPRLFRSRS